MEKEEVLRKTSGTTENTILKELRMKKIQKRVLYGRNNNYVRARKHTFVSVDGRNKKRICQGKVAFIKKDQFKYKEKSFEMLRLMYNARTALIP